MRTLSTAFRREAQRGTQKPIVHLTFEIGPVVNVVVNDYTTFAGQTVTITAGGDGLSPHNFIEGVDFSRGASNTECATNLARAIVQRGWPGSVIVARAEANRISIARKRGNVQWTSLAVSGPSGLGQESTLPVSVTMVSGEQNFGDALALVERVGNFGGSLDILRNTVARTSITIEVADNGRNSLIRKMGTRTSLQGCSVLIRIGYANISSLTDWFQWGRYYVTDVEWNPGYCVLTLTGVQKSLDKLIGSRPGAADDEKFINWSNVHPIRGVRRLLEGVLASTEFLTTGLDYTAYPDISHLGVSATEDWQEAIDVLNPNAPQRLYGASYTNVRAKPFIEELLRMVDGYLLNDNEGRLFFSRFNTTNAIVRTFQEADLADFRRTREPFRYTRILVNGEFAWYRDAANQSAALNDYRKVKPITFVDMQDEIAAQYQSPATGNNIDEQTLELDFSLFLGRQFSVINNWVSSPTSGPGDQIGIVIPQNAALAGSRQNGAGTQADIDRIGLGGREAYLFLISNNTTNFNETEIIRCNAYALAPGERLNNIFGNYYTFTADGNPYRDPTANPATLDTEGRFTIAERAWVGDGQTLNTADGANTGAWVYDATAGVIAARAKLRRFVWGVPVYIFRRPLIDIDLELNDLVGLVHSQYVNFNRNGSNANMKWQVVGLELDIFSDSPGIIITVALALDPDVPTLSFTGMTLPVTYPVFVIDPVVERNGSFVLDRGGATVFQR